MNQTVQLVPEDQARGRWRFDRSVSIPTLLLVMSAFLGAITYAQDIKTIALKADDKATRAEVAQASQGQANANQIAALRGEMAASRAEMRGDIKEVNEKLDRLIFELGVNNPKASRWTK